ncbi:unnamed protein product [Rotaria sp. Silwood2]|nr:unnamed protein product [Rotaria sp. Silwood2]CAF2954551.1 unnamed protein product [Rotaria sp. Silwood2]CAF3293073.1 unnamed protein product [Rotaria sp. Silwood2]CAF3428821.1 unnamed protein product [Rotaria sp. Silwood2]CAF4201595.1 unnamed protein product [Rotaria sp. Silwood2]
MSLAQAFFKVQSLRIQTLIQPFVSHLDISDETDQWIQTYLRDLFAEQNIVTLHLQNKHIAVVSKYLLSIDIQSMHVVSSDWTTDILKEEIGHLRQSLK